jgi:hypothetical protein
VREHLSAYTFHTPFACFERRHDLATTLALAVASLGLILVIGYCWLIHGRMSNNVVVD